MHASPQTLTTPTPPPGVLQLVEAALHRGLLEDVDSLADGLQRTGWQRDTHGGWWTDDDAPAWTIVSSIDPAHVSIFATGPDDVVATAADQIASQLTAGNIQGLATGETDDLGVRTWRAEAVNLELYFDPTRTIDLPHKTIQTPCTLHLAVARNDAPSDARFTDDERSRRLAHEGTPTQRWYLAGQQDLPDDVVQALALDEDATVVAALRAGSRQRGQWREGVAAGAEDA